MQDTFCILHIYIYSCYVASNLVKLCSQFLELSVIRAVVSYTDPKRGHGELSHFYVVH